MVNSGAFLEREAWLRWLQFATSFFVKAVVYCIIKKGGAKPMSDHIYAQSEIFAVVRQLLKKYHAESAILFGSYARQEADATSDIDLIVVGGSKFDPTDIFCIAEELHRAMGKAVDVYELREVNTGSAFYHTIMEEGVRIA